MLSGCIALCLKPNQQQQQEERAGDAKATCACAPPTVFPWQSFDRAHELEGEGSSSSPPRLPACLPARRLGWHARGPHDGKSYYPRRQRRHLHSRYGRAYPNARDREEDEAAEEETERTGGLIWTQAPVASTVGANSSDVSNPSPHSSMFIHPKT